MQSYIKVVTQILHTLNSMQAPQSETLLNQKKKL